MSLLLAAAAALAVAFVFWKHRSALPDYDAPSAPAECIALATGNEAFALDLYRQLKSGKGNLFVSPYSISTGLAMTHAGARGNTGKQIAEALHWGTRQIDPVFGQLQRHLAKAGQSPGITLETANGLWVQKGEPLLPAFSQTLDKDYLAECRQVDFPKSPETVRNDINNRVRLETKGTVRDVLAQGALDSSARLVLVNAIYFKAEWETRFDPKATCSSGFDNPNGAVECQMMECTGRFKFSDGSGAPGSPKVIELPYAHGTFSMIVLLPVSHDGLPDLEARLTPQHLRDWLRHAKATKVAVALPRFTLNSEFNLAATLKAMGIVDAFSGARADFSGIAGTKDLWLFSVLHQTHIEVNEEGSTAGAATEIILGRGGSLLPTFLADHPFLFLIRDNWSGSILFLGRVVDPSRSS